MNNFFLCRQDELSSLNELRKKYTYIINDVEAEIISKSYNKVIPVLFGALIPDNKDQVRFVKALSGEIQPETTSQIAWRKYIVIQQAEQNSIALLKLKQTHDTVNKRKEDILSQTRHQLNDTLANLNIRNDENNSLRDEVADLKNRILLLNNSIKSREQHVSQLATEAKRKKEITSDLLKAIDTCPQDIVQENNVYIKARINLITEDLLNISADDLGFLYKNKWSYLDTSQLTELHNKLFNFGGDPNMIASLRIEVEKNLPKRTSTTGWSPENAFGIHANTDGQ